MLSARDCAMTPSVCSDEDLKLLRQADVELSPLREFLLDPKRSGRWAADVASGHVVLARTLARRSDRSDCVCSLSVATVAMSSSQRSSSPFSRKISLAASARSSRPTVSSRSLRACVAHAPNQLPE